MRALRLTMNTYTTLGLMDTAAAEALPVIPAAGTD
jgi:hypothetical protein